MNQSPQDLARIFELSRRKKYSCPVCTDLFFQEPKLFQHGSQVHQTYLEGLAPSAGGEARIHFAQLAIEHGQKQNNGKDKAAGLNLPPAKNPSNNEASPSYINQASPPQDPVSRPIPAPERTYDSQRENINRRTFTRTLTPGRDGKAASLGSTFDKRGNISGSPDPVHGGYTGAQLDTDPSYAHDAVGKPAAGQESGLNREKRGSSGYKQLYDPIHGTLAYVKTEPIDWNPGTSGLEYRRYASKDFPKHSKSRPDHASERPQVVHHGNANFNQNSPRRRILGRGQTEPDDQHDEAEDSQDEPQPDTTMLRQPETRPISHDQLVVEVKGIYAGLVMVEAKCIDVDEKQSKSAQEKDPSKRVKLQDDQWQSLIALHKQLLHEHHDFFLASQHPSASNNLSKLAAKYSMPARMWRHGIHAFLEVLRHRLPSSLEHMLAFIYIAYSTMALLLETVPTFEDTWIECLGDLGRYRMAIEDDEPRDREIWIGVARSWYSKAADKNPTVGRLYHHLAILARPYTIEQLSYYTRSLTCVTPFESARGSIMTLFNPILNNKESAYHRSSSLETTFIKAHGILFTYPEWPLEEYDTAVAQLIDGLLDENIAKLNVMFQRIGVSAAVSNVAAVLEFGATTENTPRSPIRRALEVAESKRTKDQASAFPLRSASSTFRKPYGNYGSPQVIEDDRLDAELPESEQKVSSMIMLRASFLAFSTLRIAIERHNWEYHVLPLVHVMLTFIWALANADNAIQLISKDIPWPELCLYMNYIATKPDAMTSKVLKTEFPKPAEGPGRPLPEDFVMRGQLYTLAYYPSTWFTDAGVEDGERSLEMPSMEATRGERALWLGHCISSLQTWIRYDNEIKAFEPMDDTKLQTALNSQYSEDLFATAYKATDTESFRSDAPVPDTPSSMTSHAPSDAPPAIAVPTSVSTATDMQTPEIQEEASTPKMTSDEPYDDIPMMDISPRKGEHEPTLLEADDHGLGVPDASADVAGDQSDPLPIKPGIIPSWGASTVVDPGSSPPSKNAGSTAATDQHRAYGEDDNGSVKDR